MAYWQHQQSETERAKRHREPVFARGWRPYRSSRNLAAVRTLAPKLVGPFYLMCTNHRPVPGVEGMPCVCCRVPDSPR